MSAVGFRLRSLQGKEEEVSPGAGLPHGAGARHRGRGPAQADREVRAPRVRRVLVAPEPGGPGSAARRSASSLGRDSALTTWSLNGLFCEMHLKYLILRVSC